MKKLSIIIPAYNAENYIERCIDSILDQQYNNEIEIIVVNDGSTDSTEDILDNYCRKYPTLFKIVKRENGGVSSARNAGLDVATGDWIWFCDADDYIVRNGLSYVLDNFVDDSIDICTFCSISLDSIALKSFRELKSISGDVIFEGTTITKYNQHFPWSVWNHLYRLSAIKGIMFRNVTMCEDVAFNLDVYMRNLRIRTTNANVYRYTINNDQLTRQRDENTSRKAIKSYEFLFDLAKSYEAKLKDESISIGNDLFFSKQFTPFVSRLLSANLTRREFLSIITQFRQKEIFPISVYEKRDRIINVFCQHSALYPIGSFVYRKVFLPFILPKISRN